MSSIRKRKYYITSKETYLEANNLLSSRNLYIYKHDFPEITVKLHNPKQILTGYQLSIAEVQFDGGMFEDGVQQSKNNKIEVFQLRYEGDLIIGKEEQIFSENFQRQVLYKLQKSQHPFHKSKRHQNDESFLKDKKYNIPQNILISKQFQILLKQWLKSPITLMLLIQQKFDKTFNSFEQGFLELQILKTNDNKIGIPFISSVKKGKKVKLNSSYKQNLKLYFQFEYSFLQNNNNKNDREMVFKAKPMSINELVFEYLLMIYEQEKQLQKKVKVIFDLQLFQRKQRAKFPELSNERDKDDDQKCCEKVQQVKPKKTQKLYQINSIIKSPLKKNTASNFSDTISSNQKTFSKTYKPHNQNSVDKIFKKKHFLTHDQEIIYAEYYENLLKENIQSAKISKKEENQHNPALNYHHKLENVLQHLQDSIVGYQQSFGQLEKVYNQNYLNLRKSLKKEQPSPQESQKIYEKLLTKYREGKQGYEGNIVVNLSANKNEYESFNSKKPLKNYPRKGPSKNGIYFVQQRSRSLTQSILDIGSNYDQQGNQFDNDDISSQQKSQFSEQNQKYQKRSSYRQQQSQLPHIKSVTSEFVEHTFTKQPMRKRKTTIVDPFKLDYFNNQVEIFYGDPTTPKDNNDIYGEHEFYR